MFENAQIIIDIDRHPVKADPFFQLHPNCGDFFGADPQTRKSLAAAALDSDPLQKLNPYLL
jgi:hypothetical protein